MQPGRGAQPERGERQRSGRPWRGRRRTAPRALLGVTLVLGAALSLPPTAAAAPGPPPPSPPPAASPAALSPADLPAARATPTTIAPVPFTPGSRDATGARVARSAGPLHMVAVTWTGPDPDRIEVRSTDAAGRWGTWTALDAVADERTDAPPPTAPARGGSDPIWVGDRTSVQVRATRGGAPVEDGLGVLRIDPGTSPGDDAIARRARERVAAPAYVSRAQWGADERMMSWPPEYTPAVRAVTVHHTAESNDYGPDDSARIVRGIYAYHAKSQGWGDIGYNALVDRFGTVFEGRAGGMDRSVTAAHAGGFNRETFGIAYMGELSRAAATPPQFQSVAALAAWKLGGLYRDPEQRVDLVSTGGGTSRFPKGRAANVPALFAHRDVGSTACPGDAAYASMPALRARVRDLLNVPAPDKREALRPPAAAGAPG